MNTRDGVNEMNDATFLGDVARAGGFDAGFMRAWADTMIDLRDMFGCDAERVADVIIMHGDDLIDGYYPAWIGG